MNKLRQWNFQFIYISMKDILQQILKHVDREKVIHYLLVF